MKKNRGDEPIGVILHINMEISQGNSCVATFIPNNKKYHFFKFFYKIREQEGGTGPAQRMVWYQWEGGVGRERGREDEYGANTVCTCM
jgi:hypothetical protein